MTCAYSLLVAISAIRIEPWIAEYLANNVVNDCESRTNKSKKTLDKGVGPVNNVRAGQLQEGPIQPRCKPA